jgi:hypothetical protein
MEGRERTRNRLLDHARRIEKQALGLTDEHKQDILLDVTVSLRVLANLPSYTRHSNDNEHS